MKKNNCFALGFVFVVSVLVFAAPAQAQSLPFNITFSAGAEPSDFGYGGSGGDNPANNGSLDPANGVWNAGSGTSSAWARGGNGIQSSLSPGATHLTGFAEIRPNSPSGNMKNQIVAGVGLPDADFVFGFANNELRWHPNDGGGAGGFTTIGPVTFNPGQFHKIGWEVELSSGLLTAFFDDVQVGVAQDTSGGNANGDDNLFFGSGASGSQDNTWTRVVVDQVPEPGSLTLLGIGSLLALGTWRRRRR